MSELNNYTVDLVAEARAGRLDPVIGREPELRRAMQILGRRTKNNPVLIGEPGVGKTAIVEGLAIKIAEGRVPESLKNRRILSLDLAQLMAGTRFRGDFEERLKQVVATVMADPTIVLFIDELHAILGAGGGEGGLDAANMLKPALARREFSCIGATTTEEYTKYLSRDKALSRRFQPLHVAEPSREDALVIMRGIKERYEGHHRVRIADAALVAAVQLASDYIPDRYLPDKAIDLIDEAASQLKLELESVPEEVALAEEQLMRLRIEQRAVESEDGKASSRYRHQSERVNSVERRVEWLHSEWRNQRETVAKIRDLLEQEDRLRAQEEKARRSGELDLAAHLTYVQLPQLSLEIEELEAKLLSADGERALMRDCVVAADVVAVTSLWTGLPIEALRLV